MTTLIVGDPEVFAIESEITHAYDRSRLMALGFFVIHIDGRRYGVKAWNATMLGNPFDEAGRKPSERGRHNAACPMDEAAGDIAYSFRRAVYCETNEDERFFGLTAAEFSRLTSSSDWAAYCDEAFDDGSYVLQFEQQSRVRLIAFTSSPDGLYDPASLRAVSLSSSDFYRILQEWYDRFEGEWSVMPKSPAIATFNESLNWDGFCNRVTFQQEKHHGNHDCTTYSYQANSRR